MRIELESVPPRHRQKYPIVCFLCGGRFVPGPATARAYGDDGLDCGEVCYECLRGGAERILACLEINARWNREIAEENEELLEEGISELPTLEELRMMERISALDE
jgi:hypothetical protein